MTKNKHTFAVYVAELSSLVCTGSDDLTFNDKELFNRLATVLRLHPNDCIIFFDQTQHITCSIHEHSFAQKNKIQVKIDTIALNCTYTPRINLYQGLTKKSTFEDIVYNAAQLGVTSIIPVITTKIHKIWLTQHDLPRLTAIAIAGCEQAKQFTLPTIHMPQALNTVASSINQADTHLLLDPTGPSLVHFINQIPTIPTNFNIFIGPEGGFIEEETALLHSINCSNISLGTSILRSQDAAFLSTGIIRSL